MKVVALLPAHNEEEGIVAAIQSLRRQTRQPDDIYVIADNCTDRTVELARREGVNVYETIDNRHKKAGGLNQVISMLLHYLDDEDVLLVQDADSFLDPEFISLGLAAYGPGVGGVGGVFRGRIDAPSRWGRMLQHFQANEYARYELDIRRQRGKVLVLTGTATLLRVGIVREVIARRADGTLPGDPYLYDTKVLTEDNEASFALMHLGYTITSPRGCGLTTETMPTLRALAQQRLRWKRGALENLFDYGWTSVTRSYWRRQVYGVIGVIVTFTYIGSLVYALAVGLNLVAFWLIVTALFSLERVVTVRRRGWKHMLVASTVVIEMLYDFVLQGVQATAYVHAATNRERKW